MRIQENKQIENDISLKTMKEPSFSEKALASFQGKILNRAGIRKKNAETLMQPNIQNLVDKPYVEVTSTEQLEQILQKSKIPVVIDFYAPWCHWCKVVDPVFEEAARSLSGKYLFVKVNVDIAPEIAQKYQIAGIPRMMEYQKMEKSKDIVGSGNIITYLRDLISKNQ